MGLTQTKLHWCVLDQDWPRCLRRIEKTDGREARTRNMYGDTPLHLACYDGHAPPQVIRALIDASPDAVQQANRRGRRPLELAAKNYRRRGPHRSEVLALLRWHRPGVLADAARDSQPDLFSTEPPEQMFSTSALCIVCLEDPATVALLPCGHICLCMHCAPTALKKGRCPIGRCEVEGLYRLQGEQVRIHASMCECEEREDLISPRSATALSC